jgi:N-acetyl-1-D-myo-inositol-2-amino-2-deoxy-alpha-D-glucopyranoside deacetylase
MIKKNILSVLAHPDDESFGMGGTLAYYSSQGVEVYLICATRGEVGEVEPEFMDGFMQVRRN